MATSNKESVKILFTILFILYVVSFFHFILYPAGLWAIGWKLELPFIAIQIFLLVSTHIYKKILFRKLFKWYFILIVINMFTCLFFRKQGLLVSLYAWTPLLLIFYYPFFKYLRISTRGWEKVLFSLFIIILIGYTLQNIFLNTPLFVLNSTEEQLENETRVRIWSNNILTLGGDELHLVGDIPEQEWLMDEVKKYVANAYVINPQADYQDAPATKIKGMPYDLMTLITRGR